MSDESKKDKSLRTLTDDEVETERSLVGRRSSVTDRDSGRRADPAGCGRGGPRTSGITDRDPNDPAGNGRGARRCSDSDGGRYADPVGAGRRC